jgi:hypothetical protein
VRDAMSSVVGVVERLRTPLADTKIKGTA